MTNSSLNLSSNLKVLELLLFLALKHGMTAGQQVPGATLAAAMDDNEAFSEPLVAVREASSHETADAPSEGVSGDSATSNVAPDGSAATAFAPDAAGGRATKPDFNSDIFYRNKVEFSIEGGALPINLPFVFDVFVGGNYAQNPLHYTAVPVFPSVRWQMGKINGPWFLRGNTDMTFTFSVTGFPRGPEKLYDAVDLGFRRNFVPRNWRVTPYFEVRMGAGMIDAQEPYGNSYAQGQDLTFTLMVGTGFRYNFNSRYSMAIGATYFHVSNAYLSEPKYDDNGINVCGPLLGFNVLVSRPRR
jgi:hypothetical protein